MWESCTCLSWFLQQNASSSDCSGHPGVSSSCLCPHKFTSGSPACFPLLCPLTHRLRPRAACVPTAPISWSDHDLTSFSLHFIFYPGFTSAPLPVFCSPQKPKLLQGTEQRPFHTHPDTKCMASQREGDFAVTIKVWILRCGCPELQRTLNLVLAVGHVEIVVGGHEPPGTGKSWDQSCAIASKDPVCAIVDLGLPASALRGWAALRGYLACSSSLRQCWEYDKYFWADDSEVPVSAASSPLVSGQVLVLCPPGGHPPQCPLEAWPSSAACLPADITLPTEEGQGTEVRTPFPSFYHRCVCLDTSDQLSVPKTGSHLDKPPFSRSPRPPALKFKLRTLTDSYFQGHLCAGGCPSVPRLPLGEHLAARSWPTSFLEPAVCQVCDPVSILLLAVSPQSSAAHHCPLCLF